VCEPDLSVGASLGDVPLVCGRSGRAGAIQGILEGMVALRKDYGIASDAKSE
jgi:hypothetical protein